ncbi:MAG TPA: hypothetical protein PK529_06945 [Verrucomicrobiales bacterium]|nr:hypothetical protein [Verrucomicrobiales bacterium]
MRNIDLDTLVSLIPEMDLSELRALEMSVKVAIKMRTQGNLSTDAPMLVERDEEGPGLNDQAKMILEGVDDYELTLADQALLAALLLSDAYQQDSFSSRDLNDVIAECGRPRVAHITSAIAGLTSRSYLTGSTKALSLSKEGRAKARGLIGMIKRRASAA